MDGVTKPWHGVNRNEISWSPTVDEELCVSCGLCVTGCGRMVYRFDFDKKIPVVVDPLHCMVGCVTCANTCPQHAISFPPLSYVHRLIKGHHLVKHAQKALNENREQFVWEKAGELGLAPGTGDNNE